MFPRPTRNYTRAIITGGFVLVLLIPQVIGGIRLFAGPGYPGFGPLPVFVFAMLAPVQFTQVFAIVQLVRTERDLRAAVRGDARIAPEVLTQPDRLQALRDGEWLTLERRKRTRIYGRDVGLYTVFMLVAAAVLAYLGEAIIFLAVPHATGWIMAWIFSRPRAPMYVPPPRLTPFEWCLVLLPVVLALALCIYAIWEQVTLRRQVITCDDHGITVKWFLRRRAFIPWNDIHLLINGFGPMVTYWLRGAQRGIVLDLGPGVLLAADGRPRNPVYDYLGGIDAYEGQVRRLLASIVVRAHVPQRTWATGYYQRTHNQASLPLGLTADEVTAMPLAGALAQPLPGTVAAAAASTAPITLCANIPLRALLRSAITYGLASAIPILALVGLIRLAETGGNFSRAFGGFVGPGDPIAGAFSMCILYGLGIVLAAQSYRARTPAITAAGDGLTVTGFNQKKLGTIGWADIRAWAMVQPAPGATEAMGLTTTYAIYTKGDSVTWTEPANARLVWQRVSGDPRAAYRATAEQLHATIAARTGLPLHLISPRQ